MPREDFLLMHCLISPMSGLCFSPNRAFLSTTSVSSTITSRNPNIASLAHSMTPGHMGGGVITRTWHPRSTLCCGVKGHNGLKLTESLQFTIVEDTTFYPKFDKFCKPACYVDEHYFPTMLTIQASNLLANRSITWVDWSRGGAHPATFGRADITEEFLKKVFEGHSCLYNNQPSSVCFLFARKFAPSALEPLLLVAPKYFGY
ncbi:hypothetical protein HYC85_027245 [Camellia sinensis]|uniref:Uncharacterized protein n=1 Tax=Camellia sinensis TaxID=4442 RepID=A0A7J7G9X9_CAMSI|nr:hypothetical protein HYC85_027245 [Camellia sinensis]